MSRNLNVVAIGGGSGLATLLRGLKSLPINLSAVVTMSDNGASSGRLSRELGTLPPGDVRKCLAALAKDESLLNKLFEYRFQRGRGLSGHSLGNLLLLALADITGDFESAVEASGKILSIKGKVIPSTLDHVSLIGKLENGQTALGEVDIPLLAHRFGLESVELVPPNVRANPSAVTAINEAGLIIIGPGSLYTSLVPNFLIDDIRRAYQHSRAWKFYVCNASTERGETEGYSVEDHIKVIQKYSGKAELTAALVNSHIVEVSTQEGKLGAVQNITTKSHSLGGVPIFLADLINRERPLYHDSQKLGQTVWSVLERISQSLPVASS